MMSLLIGYSFFVVMENPYLWSSLKTSMSRVLKKCVYALYKNCVGEFNASHLPVQKQTNVYNCRLFAMVFVLD